MSLLSGIKIEKVTGIPSIVYPNRFYLVEEDGVESKLYLSDTNANLVLLTGGAGGSGTLTIGDAIASGTGNRVLFEDALNQLSESADLQWDGSVLAIVGNVTVDDEVYGITWDASVEVPTKNAVYDKIETIGTSAYIDGGVADSVYGGVTEIDGGTA